MRSWLRRIGTIFLFIAVALCLAPAIVPPFLDRHYYQGPTSGHYDGERFFNPGEAGSAISRRGTAGFLNRWISGEGRNAWPDRVPVSPGKPPSRVDGGAMLVTWIGHSTVLIQTDGLNILTDPIWSETASPFPPIGPNRVRAPGVRFEDLPKIDLVLLSHNHYDHLDLPTLKRLWQRDRPAIVTGLGNDKLLADAGISAFGLDWGQHIGRVTAERVHHWSARWGPDRNRALWSGFTVALPGGNLFFAGDTGWGGGDWARAARKHGPYRLAILPIGAYEPADVMRPNHMDPAEAVAAFEQIGARQALGVHWGTFQLTFEAIDDPPRRLAEAARQNGLPPGSFITTEVGRSFRVP